MALLTSISRSRKSNTMHLFISSAFSCLNLSTSRNTRWLHTAYPSSLLAFAAAWYRWRDILVQYALASLPKVSAINATADCRFSSFLRSLKRQPPPIPGRRVRLPLLPLPRPPSAPFEEPSSDRSREIPLSSSSLPCTGGGGSWGAGGVEAIESPPPLSDLRGWGSF
jgi:hypothetical protein